MLSWYLKVVNNKQALSKVIQGERRGNGLSPLSNLLMNFIYSDVRRIIVPSCFLIERKKVNFKMDVHFGIRMVYFQKFDCLKVFYLFYFLNIIDSRY